ncbi:hypothetical protein ACQYWY_06840 [Comamonas sediminis]|uniref:hypothetical protein n=1 Tax=Comamonas sediminis TaxID=1783360 RepID=UPI003D27C5F4
MQMIPTDYDKRTPMPDGSQNDPLNTELGRNVRNTVNALPGVAGVPGALGAGGGLLARAFSAAAPAAPYAPAAGLATAIGAGSSTAAPVPAPAAPSAPSNAGSYNYQPQAKSGPPVPTAGATPAPSAPQMNGLVSRIGNSYSGTNVGGSITVNGNAPAGGFMEGSGGGSLVQRAFSSPPVPQVDAPQVANSTNDYAARKQLENLATSASSITNTSRWGGRGAEGNPAVRAYRSALATDAALQQQQAGLDNSAMVQQANLQREAQQQEGANSRSLVQAALEQQRITQAGTAAGYANRAAGQAEQMRDSIMTETDPTRRRSLVDTMLAMEGKQTQADPYLVVPGGQQVDALSGRAYNTPSAVFNRQTGQWVQQPGQGAQHAPGELGNPASRPVGTVSTVNGKTAVWNGQTWVPNA